MNACNAMQLLDDCMGGVGAQGAARRRGLQQEGVDGDGADVQLPERAGGCGVRGHGPQRGAGHPSHHPVHARQAVQEAHVAGRPTSRGVHRLGDVFGNAVDDNILITLEKPWPSSSSWFLARRRSPNPICIIALIH